MLKLALLPVMLVFSRMDVLRIPAVLLDESMVPL